MKLMTRVKMSKTMSSKWKRGDDEESERDDRLASTIRKNDGGAGVAITNRV
jgi:hypothetical protein